MKEYDTLKNALLEKCHASRRRANAFFEEIKVSQGYKYTSSHDVAKYPAALLYGTWAAILGNHLIGITANWSSEQRSWAIAQLRNHQRQDGTFLGWGLQELRNSKSQEYLILHCTNYAHGAALALDLNFDFQTPYLHRFLDGDVLQHWLDGRSFARPWEESNNIVNVASYLALCNEYGEPRAASRLDQMLAWHRKYQNPKTGGFDNFASPRRRHILQSLAGAVHNFHIHLYMNERLGYEEQIASALPQFLYQGRLTACLSIDFVELAIRTLPWSPNPQLTIWALLHHANALLVSQRSDGGWLEAENDTTVTTAAGFKDTVPSSCSYATWFRLCSLAMIAITLLGDSPSNWNFRGTLGMGYAPDYWPSIPSGVEICSPPIKQRLFSAITSLPDKAKQYVLTLGGKAFG